MSDDEFDYDDSFLEPYSPTILDDISFYIEDLSFRYNVVNVVLIILESFVSENCK